MRWILALRMVGVLGFGERLFQYHPRKKEPIVDISYARTGILLIDSLVRLRSDLAWADGAYGGRRHARSLLDSMGRFNLKHQCWQSGKERHCIRFNNAVYRIHDPVILRGSARLPPIVRLRSKQSSHVLKWTVTSFPQLARCVWREALSAMLPPSYLQQPFFLAPPIDRQRRHVAVGFKPLSLDLSGVYNRTGASPVKFNALLPVVFEANLLNGLVRTPLL